MLKPLLPGPQHLSTTSGASASQFITLRQEIRVRVRRPQETLREIKTIQRKQDLHFKKAIINILKRGKI